jgi:cytochrome c553
MMSFVNVLPLLLGIIVFGGLLWWMSRLQNSALRWLGVISFGLLTLLLILVTSLALVGDARLSTNPGNLVSQLQVTGSPDQIARGQSLVHMCSRCHSSAHGLPLDGGTANAVPSFIGNLVPPNLTPGGPLKSWSDGEIIRAIREGIGQNGYPLLVMPSSNFRKLSDADVEAIVAYLRSQPAVDHGTNTSGLNVFGVALVGAGALPTSAQSPVVEPSVMPAGVTPEYGQYLVDVIGCRSCHGNDLSGGQAGGSNPNGPNLTTLVPKWTEAQFIQTLRTGVDPTGYRLNSLMPWKDFGGFAEDDLRAIYAYLRTLTPIPH